MMMGIQGQHSDNLARTQPDADINHPDEAVGKGGLIQGQAPQSAGRVDAHDGEPDHPIDDGLRTRCLLDAKRESQQSQDTRDRAKADAGLKKELQGEGDHVDLWAAGESAQPRLQLSHSGLRRVESVGELIALGLDTPLLSSLVTLALAALLGFLFPLSPAVFHFGELAHDASLRGHSNGSRPGSEMQVGLTMSHEHKMIRDPMHRSADRRAERLSPLPHKGSS
jgi:hypothetical protein